MFKSYGVFSVLYSSIGLHYTILLDSIRYEAHKSAQQLDGWMDTNTTAYIVHTYIIEAICVSVTPTQKLNQHIYAAELKQKQMTAANTNKE